MPPCPRRRFLHKDHHPTIPALPQGICPVDLCELQPDAVCVPGLTMPSCQAALDQFTVWLPCTNAVILNQSAVMKSTMKLCMRLSSQLPLLLLLGSLVGCMGCPLISLVCVYPAFQYSWLPVLLQPHSQCPHQPCSPLFFSGIRATLDMFSQAVKAYLTTIH